MKTILVVILASTFLAAQKNTVYSFAGGADGIDPSGAMVFDQNGNLYGTTRAGGDSGLGTVFKLTPDGLGGWTETIVYSFTGSKDGERPLSGLTIDAAGNIYGTTFGLDGPHCPPSCGAVFELPANGGPLKTIHTFKGKDGGLPDSRLDLDSAGNIYGATIAGGAKDFGTVFRLTNINGTWKIKTLHTFAYDKFGADPQGNLAMDANGVIYGTTSWAGAKGKGTVFRLAPQQGGSYQLRIMHTLGPKEGQTFAGLSIDSTGTIYGTLPLGGSNSCVGNAYTMVPTMTGRWIKTTIATFCKQLNGRNPTENPISDSLGNLYGTTLETVYQLLPQSDGTWQSNLLYRFADHSDPRSGVLVFGPDGNLYGTTQGGGEGYGTVFSIAP
jgi:uncharacterized repeat protein (TIGR03803 family)